MFVVVKNDIIFDFKSKIMTAIKKDYTPTEIAKLAEAFDKSTQTIERWIKNTDDRLTSDKAKAALKTSKK
jgi:transposase